MGGAAATDQAGTLPDRAAPLVWDGGWGRRHYDTNDCTLAIGLVTSAQRMVAEQLIPHGVTDERVLRVMSEIPREEFLTGRARRHAYEDRALAIGWGQTISQPLVVALMTQSLKL